MQADVKRAKTTIPVTSCKAAVADGNGNFSIEEIRLGAPGNGSNDAYGK